MNWNPFEFKNPVNTISAVVLASLLSLGHDRGVIAADACHNGHKGTWSEKKQIAETKIRGYENEYHIYLPIVYKKLQEIDFFGTIGWEHALGLKDEVVRRFSTEFLAYGFNTKKITDLNTILAALHYMFEELQKLEVKDTTFQEAINSHISSAEMKEHFQKIMETSYDKAIKGRKIPSMCNGVREKTQDLIGLAE